MNKIAYCLLASAAFLALAACANTQPDHRVTIRPLHKYAKGGTTCKFRYPMSVGCQDSGEYHDVSEWQTFLVEMGYMSPGNVTGTFNRSTQSGTKSFQADSGLPPTGIVDLQTFQKAANGETACIPVNIPCPKRH